MADRQYELLYILPPDSTEQQVNELHEQIASVVSRLNGQIEKTDNWGRRRLAYEIGPHKEGVYVLELINGSGDLMKELDRRLRVLDQVIRHIVVRVDGLEV
jgi:small subunit ribosomal protein S6